MNTYLISVKPKWASLFFDPASPKTVELRKGNFGKSLVAGDRLLIYATLPAGKILGAVTVCDRQELPIGELPLAEACVSAKDFDTYYADKSVGVAVRVGGPERFESSIALVALKDAGISPPQQILKLSQEQIDILFPVAESTEPTEFDYLIRDIDAAAGIASGQIAALELDKDVFPKHQYEIRLLEAQSRIAEWEKIRQAIASCRNPIGGLDRLEAEIAGQLAIAQSESVSTPKARLKRYVRIDILKYAAGAIGRARIPFSVEYREIMSRVRPKIEEDPNYTPDFAPGKLVKASKIGLLVWVDTYQFCQDGWIAECNIRISGSANCQPGDKLLIRASDLFGSFSSPCREPIAIAQFYNLGSICKQQELKSMFKRLKIPKYPIPFVSEITAPDGSIWQAVLHATNSRKTIKWMCEVLPDGLSRSPRIPQLQQLTA